MEQKVKGIVLNSFRFKESSLICHIYTNSFGRKTYMFNGIRTAKSKGKSAMVQPLFILDMDVAHSVKSDIQRVKDFRLEYAYSSIPFDPMKSSLAFFIGELLYKLLKEEQPNAPLFDFLYNALIALDVMNDGVYNFHLYLIAQLTKYLGISPRIISGIPAFFDLKSGEFTPIEPRHPNYMSKRLSQCFCLLSNADLADLGSIKMSREERSAFIEKMLQFFSIHFGSNLELKSLRVVQEIFD